MTDPMNEEQLRKAQLALFARLYGAGTHQPTVLAEYTSIVAELFRRREQQHTEDTSDG